MITAFAIGIIIGLRFKVMILIWAIPLMLAFAGLTGSILTAIYADVAILSGYLVGITLRAILSSIWTRYVYMESQQ